MIKKFGIIDISELNTPPEKHEYETAKYFSNRGFDVIFLRPSTIKGQYSPDFLMNNKRWETKSPIKYSKSSFEDNLKRATKQSEHIIYDLRRLGKTDEKRYINELRKWSVSSKIKNLIIICKDGKLLTIKTD